MAFHQQRSVVMTQHGESLDVAFNKGPRQFLAAAWHKLRSLALDLSSGANPVRMGFEIAEQAIDRLTAAARGKDFFFRSVARVAESDPSAAALLAVSKDAQKEFGSHRSVVIGALIDTDFFTPARVTSLEKDAIRKEFGIAPDERVLVYPARYHPGKGQHLLPQMLVDLKNFTSQRVKLVMVGPFHNPGYVATVADAIKRSGAGDQIIMADGRSREVIRALYSVADLKVFPTYSEGLPLSAAEAFCMGLPVVAHNVGGVRDIVQDGISGYLVPVEDMTAMARQVGKILEDNTHRVTLALSGRRFVESHYHIDSVVDKHVAFSYVPLSLRYEARKGGGRR